MAEEYHELTNVSALADEVGLTIPRAKTLFDVVSRQRDYAVVQLLQHCDDGTPKLECIVVEVECDGVPPKNGVGINYRERLALCVSDDPKQLIEVLAMRKDFPVLMHQNQGILDAPASLCLYFESVAAVMRTWTPQSFLRRIQWWLEKSARGELHPTDQPVEHLFFATRYELVLPWNLSTLRKSAEHRFVIARGPERPDAGFTCFLEAVPKDAAVKTGTAAPIELVLQPILHGFVERDPATLGQLADILSRRGIDLLPYLRAALQARVGAKGVVASADDKCTVILLHIPICRTEGAEPVGVTHRAFLLLAGGLELGVAVGALFVLDKKYFSATGLIGAQPATEWRSQPVLPMAVLSQNDAAAARKQSGITEEGPAGALVGAGSLGSAILNFWGRAGWGSWTVIDKDHIKPHNLSRHVAYAQHIGYPKATVVADLHAAAMHGASEITPLNADASDFKPGAVTDALSSVKLVVDASTTLEYPRAASMVDGFARHFSVFVTPTGNAGILLAEDAQRLLRLRTLEAQYYRALIQENWGRNHLTDNTGSFWSGASCRDISVVIPYSRIMGQASTLAEQIPLAAAQDGAMIRVWQRDPVRGTVEVHDVPVATERRMQLGEFDLFVDASVELQLRDLRTKGFPNETGGVLIGYYDFNVSAVIVVAALPAPPDSKSSPGSFERGIAGLAETVTEASRRTAGVVGYIGEWHSHPPGHSASPSRDDLVQLVHLALGMADDGLPAVQLIVGEHDLQVLQGTVK
ncbi:ThiF family adenylyltransferase [Polaromonas naphthalenivorans]|uniref:UBA/THIF-type NAD/FAD binding protein n=1 Tax=Polaromonas naphthalenivorans (strain CJ2) TaxID=365044 RepID=A1VVG1_POLNA|nr:ThiF family adenylyltransferase [Polaromonas naphthalenivorans]ABM39639.1 UBA/THIF-type NAD/FAD binding protein [Polaromonas naphthalenivorans CJ2]